MTARRAVIVAASPKVGHRRSYRWQEDAVCQDAPEVDKIALTGYPTREVARDLNRRYCNRCPVRIDCLNWAYDDKVFTGIAGGQVFVGDRSGGKRRVIEIGVDE